MIGLKYAATAAGVALLAALAAAPFTDLPVASMAAKAPEVLSILHKRSPGERQSGALTNKKGRVTMKLPAAVESRKAPVAPLAVPAAAPVATSLPVSQAPLALPLAVAPMAVPIGPLAAAPAAVGGGFFIPPIIVPSSGGGGGPLVVTPPGGGGAPPPPVPAIPEPETWAMMIIGFGMLGAFLRKRRRSVSELLLTRVVGAASLQSGSR